MYAFHSRNPLPHAYWLAVLRAALRFMLLGRSSSMGHACCSQVACPQGIALTPGFHCQHPRCRLHCRLCSGLRVIRVKGPPWRIGVAGRKNEGRKKETVTHNRRGLSGRPAPIKGAAALKRSTGHLRAARTESNQVHAAGSTPACQSHSLGACSCNMHHNCRQTGNMHAHTSDHAALPRTPPLEERERGSIRCCAVLFGMAETRAAD